MGRWDVLPGGDPASWAPTTHLSRRVTVHFSSNSCCVSLSFSHLLMWRHSDTTSDTLAHQSLLSLTESLPVLLRALLRVRHLLRFLFLSFFFPAFKKNTWLRGYIKFTTFTMSIMSVHAIACVRISFLFKVRPSSGCAEFCRCPMFLF